MGPEAGPHGAGGGVEAAGLHVRVVVEEVPPRGAGLVKAALAEEQFGEACGGDGAGAAFRCGADAECGAQGADGAAVVAEGGADFGFLMGFRGGVVRGDDVGVAARAFEVGAGGAERGEGGGAVAAAGVGDGELAVHERGLGGGECGGVAGGGFGEVVREGAVAEVVRLDAESAEGGGVAGGVGGFAGEGRGGAVIVLGEAVVAAVEAHESGEVGEA
ncbi:hypothetical protein ACU686_32960 [Yinghuangia aomiensis]